MAQAAAGAEVEVEVIGPRTVAPAEIGAEVEVQATGPVRVTPAPKRTEISSPGIDPTPSGRGPMISYCNLFRNRP